MNNYEQQELPGAEAWETSSIEQLHAQVVERLFKKPSHHELRAISEAQYNLFHAAMGIATEAGELLDAVKKHLIYNKPLDIENVKEELGDLEFYLRAFFLRLGISRKEVLEENIAKLSKRYPNLTYTDKDAIERKDKE